MSEVEMKILLVLTLVFIGVVPFSYAKVEQHVEESLVDDLNFKLDDTSESERKVASEETDNATENTDEQQRDIASDAEDTNPTIKYWKY
jgi:hypothetical protein